jgi:glycerol-3-phosphate acyltransferase PlsY
MAAAGAARPYDRRVVRVAPPPLLSLAVLGEPLVALEGAAGAGLVVACLAAAYLLGTVPTAVVVAGRWGVDPRLSGSGNPGATNVARTAGWRPGVLTLAGDLAKGMAATGLGWAAGGRTLGVACGAVAVLGHVAPATRRFRGGKGVATAAGVALVAFPLATLAAVAGFALAAGVSRRASVGSLAAVATLPVVAAALGAPGVEVAALAACGILVAARHRTNIERLLRGTEPPLWPRRAGALRSGFRPGPSGEGFPPHGSAEPDDT